MSERIVACARAKVSFASIALRANTPPSPKSRRPAGAARAEAASPLGEVDASFDPESLASRLGRRARG